jgi:hypothetical protein
MEDRRSRIGLRDDAIFDLQSSILGSGVLGVLAVDTQSEEIAHENGT